MRHGLTAGLPRGDRRSDELIEDLSLRREATAGEDKFTWLYKLVTERLTDLDDLLKEQIAKLKADRDKASSALERIER